LFGYCLTKIGRPLQPLDMVAGLYIHWRPGFLPGPAVGAYSAVPDP